MRRKAGPAHAPCRAICPHQIPFLLKESGLLCPASWGTYPNCPISLGLAGLRPTETLSFWGFPGGPVVKNPPSNAGDAGLIPGRGTKIPHAAGQISPRATTTELTCLNDRAHVLQTTEPMCRGARAPQLERSPRATMKSPCAAMTDPACLNEDPACRN